MLENATVRNGTNGTERNASKTPEETFNSHIAVPVDNPKIETIGGGSNA
jgi:hypothetical protein